MPEEIGTVVKKSDHVATVRISRSSQCSGCHSCLLSQDGTSMITDAYDPLHTEVGDRVKLEQRQVGHVKAGFILLIVPLLAFFPGYIAGEASARLTGVLPQELGGVIAGVVTFSIPFLVLYLLSKPRIRKGINQMRIVSVLSRSA